MNRQPFAGYSDSMIDKRVKVEEDKVCATCGDKISKGSLADTRDWTNYFCDEVCERKAFMKREGRAEPAPAQQKVGPKDLGGVF